MEQSTAKFASVIITTYNRADAFLIRAINSVINQQTQYVYEIIVVDDNGFDSVKQKETEILLDQYIATGTIKYLPQQNNTGACIGRNVGATHAIGKYIFFLDDDDEFMPNKIQVQTDFLENNKAFDGCLAGFKRFENNKEIIAKSNHATVGNFVNFVINGNFFTPMLCIKKDSLLKFGGFQNIERFQDRYMMLHALSKGLQFECINDSLHIMYEHNGERITNKSVEKTINSLEIIKDFISKFKKQFTILEWNSFLIKDLRMRGTNFYIAPTYWQRTKGFYFYRKAFCLSKKKKDLKMMIQSIFKF